MRSWSRRHSNRLRYLLCLGFVGGLSVVLSGALLAAVPATIQEARETARRLIVGAYPELRGLNTELRFVSAWRLDTPVRDDVATWVVGDVWSPPPGPERGNGVRPAWEPLFAERMLRAHVQFVTPSERPSRPDPPRLSIVFTGPLVDELSARAGKIRDTARGEDRLAAVAAAFTRAGAKYGPHAKEAFRSAVQLRIEGIADVLGPLDVTWVTFDDNTGDWVVDFETRSEPVTQYWMKCEPFEGRPLFIGERRKR